MPAPDVFVSYSRVHDSLVGNLTKILGVGGRLVFRDVESVKPGEEWEKSIFDSLTNAKIVVVVWCSHANESQWVLREAELAAQLNKEIIPVLIDSTPLLPCLAKFQWIDLQKDVNHARSSPQDDLKHDSSPPVPAPPFRPAVTIALSAVFLLMLMVLLFALPRLINVGLADYGWAAIIPVVVAAVVLVIWIALRRPEALMSKSEDDLPDKADLPDFGTVPFDPIPFDRHFDRHLDPVTSQVLARIAEFDRRR